MKIDLFRNKEIAEDENPYEKVIISNDVYDYILTKIDFELNEQTWKCID